MSKNHSQQSLNFSRAIKKLFLSGFVVTTFIVYAINQRFSKPNSPLSPQPTNISTVAPQVVASSGQASSLPSPAAPTAQPTATANSGLYKDGVYTGPQVDAYYGFVEVQAVIKNGKIAVVQFLQYPNDRRTSVQINAIAMPYLQQEALQVQSAHVNIISGATFTSEGFAMSLNEALKTAKN